jgi:hypothetical protein
MGRRYPPTAADRAAAGQTTLGTVNGIAFNPALPGLTTCSRCAALLLDTDPARDQHAAFHGYLRQMWDGRHG